MKAIDELFPLSPPTHHDHCTHQKLHDDLMMILTTPDGNSVDHFPVLAAVQGSCSSPHLLGDNRSPADGSTLLQHVDDSFEELMMLLMEASPDGNVGIAGPGGGDQLPQNNSGSSSQNPSHGKDTTKKRKTNHRDVERQRRQDMTSLYASLRSNLPLELRKGKRSISDHIHESVRYIKHIQTRIQELNALRDDLKGSLEPSFTNPTATAPPVDDNLQNSSYGDSTVMVKPSTAGVEVTIHTDLKQGIPLSRVLRFLVQQDLTVIIWTSTRLNERMLHLIESEVDDQRKNSDLCDLQTRLMNLLGKS